MSKKPEDLQGIDCYLWLAEYFKWRDYFAEHGMGQAWAATARGKRTEQKERHMARAVELRSEGKSVAQIAMRMAGEDGKPEPYSKRTVTRWLGAAVTKKG